MQKKKLGRTDWEILPLVFGGAAISGEGGGYGFGHISEADSIDLVHFALERGVQFFDAAPIYGFRLAEQRLGKALKSFRDQVILTSKSGVTWGANRRVDMSNDPKLAESMLLQSLKDLQTDYLDFYYIHWPDPNVDIRRPLEVLKSYQDKGVIHHIGLTNTNLEDLAKAKDVCRIESIQSEYHFFNSHIEDGILKYCLENEVAFLPWGTFDKGVLTGSYDLHKQREDVDARKSAPWWKHSDVVKKLELVEEMKELLSETSIDIKQAALLLQVTTKGIFGPLVGARNQDQWEDFFQIIESVDKIAEEVDINALISKLMKIGSKFTSD